MININSLHEELLKRGKKFTYVKVKRAVNGFPNITSDKEKKELLNVVDDIFKKVKENILKS